MNHTDEEIRIKVAEAHGTMRWSYALPTKCIGVSVPNYPEDLNACAQFEDELKNLGVFSSYLSNLALVCGFNAQGDEAWFNLHAGLQAVCSATARQRCLAYLKTKGLIP